MELKFLGIVAVKWDLIQKEETRGFDVKKKNNLVDVTILHGDGEEEEVDIIGNGEEIVPEQSNSMAK